jgi:hypothetical protein
MYAQAKGFFCFGDYFPKGNILKYPCDQDMIWRKDRLASQVVPGPNFAPPFPRDTRLVPWPGQTSSGGGHSNVCLHSHLHQYSPVSESMIHCSCTAAIGRLFTGKLRQGGPSRGSQVEVESDLDLDDSQQPRYAPWSRLCLISLVKHGRPVTYHLVHLSTSSTMIPFLSYSLSVGQ